MDFYGYKSQSNQTHPLPNVLTEKKKKRQAVQTYLRCYDCPFDQAMLISDTPVCRKVFESITKLQNKGWDDREILKELKRIYGNEILQTDYEQPKFYISFK